MEMYIVLLIAIGTAVGFQLSDEEYYQMPRLFELDDWEACLADPRAAFCLGSFDLMRGENDPLLTNIQRFSSNKYNFNHSLIHRGYCLATTCAHVRERSPRKRFRRCVENVTRARYGLRANMTRLEYCRGGAGAGAGADEPPAVDLWALVFAHATAAILLANILGTAYDLMRNNDEKKANPYLMAWSVRASWRRLTADYSGAGAGDGGDQRLAALRPLQGMKALTLILVMLAHSVLAHHYTYLFNPQFLEKASHNFFSAYFQNGTSIVQTFIMVSCFLLAYNLLLHAESKPERQLSITMLPNCLLHRITRIAPLYIFVVSLAATWWRRAGDGPLWASLVGAESARCRAKWWTHALFVNNLVHTDVRCLIHTWFVAVDMQLYVVATVLTLVLGRWPRAAIRLLCGLIVAAVVSNFAIISYWELKPMVKLMAPEFMRTQFMGQRSFEWLYSAPWDSLPAALIGLLTAFVHHAHQRDGYKPADSLIIRVLYRVTVPAMFLWVVSGYWMKGVTEPALVSLYAALDRPVFTSTTAFAMYGFFNKIDSVWWQFLSWRGWEVLGRMSLSIFMVHWLLALMILAGRTNITQASVLDIGGHWLATIFLSYCSALPLHLLIEVPAQRFLQTVFQSGR